ncbi:MAG: hypothetical protein TREMPRED_006040 [Tremellales sp. Tagirdzhanova-0007]|nr:MAG: hypothetical protein TREMPRED_006040 [Tremellales sp. Tagirdzhanova-0007]
MMFQLRYEAPPAERLYMLSTLFVSTNGKHFIGYDLALERSIKVIKDTFSSHASANHIKHMSMVESNVYFFSYIRNLLESAYQIASVDGRHTVASMRGLSLLLSEAWRQSNALDWEPGRVSNVFEIRAGDHLTALKKEAKGKQVKMPSYPGTKHMSCDDYVEGLEALRGAAPGRGVYAKLCKRRAEALWKEGSQTPIFVDGRDGDSDDGEGTGDHETDETATFQQGPQWSINIDQPTADDDSEKSDRDDASENHYVDLPLNFGDE